MEHSRQRDEATEASFSRSCGSPLDQRTIDKVHSKAESERDSHAAGEKVVQALNVEGLEKLAIKIVEIGLQV